MKAKKKKVTKENSHPIKTKNYVAVSGRYCYPSVSWSSSSFENVLRN